MSGDRADAMAKKRSISKTIVVGSWDEKGEVYEDNFKDATAITTN